MEIFAKRLRELRKEKGLSQRDMAGALHVTQVSYCHWEQGKCQTDFETLVSICRLLEVSADYLLGLTDSE